MQQRILPRNRPATLCGIHDRRSGSLRLHAARYSLLRRRQQQLDHGQQSALARIRAQAVPKRLHIPHHLQPGSAKDRIDMRVDSFQDMATTRRLAAIAMATAFGLGTVGQGFQVASGLQREPGCRLATDVAHESRSGIGSVRSGLPE